ncbi:sensor histidine kinase [Amycolatopsis regifaucium]|uniref:histidine kinase n=1 Tax=Amycolatopsis regifaucium TaxID=546365 RepID=A0A154MCE2_9PSEU|nr:sensor histidine kinase [Amycolatopsis regifaucium]KZB82268.1 histidine kinase [Amycolatopsis regifaucium]OKA05660.1 two-component sensor histidine kinase [Amycolatopsis regifaucium]SFG88109.1 Signal transduction histidine kinase [Amycolatopsis regifaucium]
MKQPSPLPNRVAHTIDALLAVVLVVAVGGNLAAKTWTFTVEIPVWLAWVAVGACAIAIVLRRHHPVTAYFFALGTMIPASLAGGGLGPASALATAAALYTVALEHPRPRSLAAMGAGLVVVVFLEFLHLGPSTLASTAFAGGGLAGSWALGWTARQRQANLAQLAAAQAHQAVSDERLRIAREMHDVVAHSMSLIAVKAAVGNHVAKEQPEEAREALRVIELTSRETLVELRRMLGVLRSGDGTHEAALGPAPKLADLRTLAERAGQAGVRVELSGEVVDELPEGVALSIYRITQEAVTNVVKHAGPSACRVTVTEGPGEVCVEIVDDGRGDGSPSAVGGHGLIGMRERVAVYGGDFEAGPLAAGGFRVFARLPYAVKEVGTR